jgi:hypothetical protein
MNHIELLNNAVGMLKEKGQSYGPVDDCFERISIITSTILGKHISTYDCAIILHAVKLARMQTERTKSDNYIDGINYLAFAGQFASRRDSVDVAMEDDIRAMARNLAPSNPPMPPATPVNLTDPK